MLNTLADKTDNVRSAYFWLCDTTRIDEYAALIFGSFFVCRGVLPYLMKSTILYLTVLGMSLNLDAFWVAMLMPIAWKVLRCAWRKGGAK